MKGQEVMFDRGINAPDGIHTHVEFNEYRPNPDERLVSIGQLFGGTMIIFGLLIAYIIVGNIELGM